MPKKIQKAEAKKAETKKAETKKAEAKAKKAETKKAETKKAEAKAKKAETKKAEAKQLEGFSCEWSPGKKPPQSTDNTSALYRFQGDFTWEGVQTEAYKQEGSNFANIARNVLIGARGESCRFHLRYFEVGPGGHSSLEKHEHEHVVVGLRGKGRAIVGPKVHEINPFDALYIAPNEPHQLVNDAEEPFGFFCIVNSERDKPVALLPDELKWLEESAQTKNLMRF